MDDSDTEKYMHPLMHDFFRSIGVATSVGVSYYFWNYVYPIKKERLITDVIWQYHLTEAKLGWFFEKINSIATPLIRRIIPEPERKEVFLYKDGVEVTSYTNMESLFLPNAEYPEHDLTVRTIIAEDETTVTLIKGNAGELNQEMKISPIHLLSASFEQKGEKQEIKKVTGKKGLANGSELFTRAHLKYCGIDVKDNDYSVSTVDNEVNMFTFTSSELNKLAVLTDKGLVVNVNREKADNEGSNKENNAGILEWFTSDKKEKDD